MIFLGILLACTEPSSKKTDSPSQSRNVQTQIDVDTLYKKQKSTPNTIIIDVRTDSEFRNGHIPNVLHHPLSTLESALNKLEEYKNQEIFLVCASGVRSQKATDLLRSKGFSKAINVQGGTRGWQAKGYPIE